MSERTYYVLYEYFGDGERSEPLGVFYSKSAAALEIYNAPKSCNRNNFIIAEIEIDKSPWAPVEAEKQ